MIHREAWYREALYEGELRILKERIKGNDIDAIYPFLHLRSRLQIRFPIRLVKLYDSAHPGMGRGALYALKSHLRRRLDRVSIYPEVSSELEKELEEISVLLNEAELFLGRLDNYSAPLDQSEHTVLFYAGLAKSFWQGAEAKSREAFARYNALLTEYGEFLAA